MDPQMARAHSTPTMGRTEPKALVTALGNTPVAALTAADFYTHMLTIIANFSNMISEKLGQTIDANREVL
jgi:hypothetical protein